MNDVKFDFTGNKYAVTGASSGMGRQVACELAAAGAVVLAIARREQELLALQHEYPDNIVIGVADVCDSGILEKTIQAFVERYGKLNGSVHAAGISGITPIKAYDKAEAHRIMDVSFWAGMDLIQLVSKVKYGECGSSHVLFSSVCGISAEKGMFAYGAAKAALNTAIKSIAKELVKKQQRINTIVPGWVVSPMTDKMLSNTDSFMGRHLLGSGQAKDISGVVLFLLSNGAKWITGTNVIVDGGYLA